ncbi:hypothetical protein T4B_4463 [Trichinella pseudospiralis]|uniref:Uncharacterized protein n=1 Tax=Trichinella pseudospiralis TaxID=6337 RepID=A0A0V1K7R2_TRIPS|nr:hypothetical protein T4A_13236 [Trichinella pseudospiralis]KRZ31101.1 hypothetical protein T4B_4463 [Trichinella pseudospiralis]KRZ43235.1 hypothetical protein T4C_11126 [Trichinella pseudospiralis]
MIAESVVGLALNVLHEVKKKSKDHYRLRYVVKSSKMIQPDTWKQKNNILKKFSISPTAVLYELPDAPCVTIPFSGSQSSKCSGWIFKRFIKFFKQECKKS